MGKVSLDPWAYWFGALLILLLPLHWLLAAVIAAAFHELCHAAAIYALGGRVLMLRIGLIGAVMETEPMSRGREFIAALAGPIGSFLLLLLGRWAPHIALCAAIQGLFNLLPLYPLDGGRALRCALEGCLTKKNIRILETSLVALTAVFLFRWWPILVPLLLIRSIFGKIPCKQKKIGLQ